MVIADTDKAKPPRSVIITGTGRSGTTAIARLSAFLGVQMATQSDNLASQAYCEHGFLRESIKHQRTEVLDRIAAEMADSLWGFKIPGEFSHCAFAARHLAPSGTCIVCVTRDTTATALCEYQFKNADGRHWLIEYASRNQRMIIEACSIASEIPMMLISYEKLLANPAAVSDCLADYLCVNRDSEAVQKMLQIKNDYYNVLERRWTEQSLQL